MQKPKASLGKSASTLNDFALWEAIAGNDESAFAKFILKYSKPLFSYGYRLCNDRDFLKDCIQDIFVDLWNRRDKIKATEQLKWYLFKSLRNSIFREQSKLSRKQPIADDYNFIVEFGVEHHHILNETERELTSKVKNTLEHLPPRQKEVLYLRFFEELPFDDIAQIMDINRQSAHNLLQKSYNTFRDNWDITTELAFILAIYSIFNR